MADLDIERLKRAMENEPNEGPHHENWCEYIHPACAALVLIDRLEEAEAERDKAAAVCAEAIEALGEVEDELERAEAQRYRLAGLVSDAYKEGWFDGRDDAVVKVNYTCRGVDSDWDASTTKNILDSIQEECKDE